MRLEGVEVHGVREQVDADGHAAAEGGPAPVVVLRVEEEVAADDGDTHLDDDQDGQDGEQEAVHEVVLVAPDGGEQEKHLDEDGPERQHSADYGDPEGLVVPRRHGDGRGNGGRAAGVGGVAVERAAEEGADDVQRQAEEAEEEEEEEEEAAEPAPQAADEMDFLNW